MKKLIVLGVMVVALLGIFMTGKKILATGHETVEENQISYESWCQYSEDAGHVLWYTENDNKSMYHDPEEGLYYVYKKLDGGCAFGTYSDINWANKDYFGRED